MKTTSQVNEANFSQFSKVTDEQLLANLKSKVENEKELTLEILRHLAEVERRRLFLAKGYPSLFEYCVKELGYGEGAAFRRISSMRLTADLPQAEKQLREGSVNVSTLSQLQRFIRKEERFRGEKMTKDHKLELLGQVQNKSQQEVEKTFASISPHIVASTETSRPINDELIELKVVISSKLAKKLERLKNLLAHRNPHAGTAEILEYLADAALKKLDPETKPASRASPPVKAPPQSPKRRHRHIPSVFRQQVWARDRGKCTFTSSSGRKCDSRYMLQVDHIIPLVGGGKTELSNLTLLCAAHNRWKGNHLHRTGDPSKGLTPN